MSFKMCVVLVNILAAVGGEWQHIMRQIYHASNWVPICQLQPQVLNYLFVGPYQTEGGGWEGDKLLG